MTATLVPDWGRILDELEGAGVKRSEIARVMGSEVNNHMLRWYRDGAQPAYWRGKRLIDFWAERLDLPVPLTELRRGHRAQGQYARDLGPRADALPQWPVAAPVAVRPIRRGRKVEVSNS